MISFVLDAEPVDAEPVNGESQLTESPSMSTSTWIRTRRCSTPRANHPTRRAAGSVVTSGYVAR
jgi:hypothetical protein